MDTCPPLLLMMNHMQILVRTTHCGVHLNITEADCYLHTPERPIEVVIYLNESVEFLLVSMEYSLVTLGSRFAVVRLGTLHPMANCEYFCQQMHLLLKHKML